MQKIPQHIAIIMDGNGRWALQRNLSRMEGHRAGVRSVRTVVDGCLRHGVSVLSLFAFSSENWQRPANEVNFLMELFVESIEREIEELHTEGVALKFIGNRQALSDILQLTIESVESLTANNQALQLNIMMNYGGRWDIVEACRKITKAVKEGSLEESKLDEQLFGQMLATASIADPDLLIRTSGELRISNFMLWQLAYSEFYFSDVKWPDFDKAEFEKALLHYASRQRRYGKTEAQCGEETDV